MQSCTMLFNTHFGMHAGPTVASTLMYRDTHLGITCFTVRDRLINQRVPEVLAQHSRFQQHIIFCLILSAACCVCC